MRNAPNKMPQRRNRHLATATKARHHNKQALDTHTLREAMEEASMTCALLRRDCAPAKLKLAAKRFCRAMLCQSATTFVSDLPLACALGPLSPRSRARANNLRMTITAFFAANHAVSRMAMFKESTPMSLSQSTLPRAIYLLTCELRSRRTRPPSMSATGPPHLRHTDTMGSRRLSRARFCT